MFGFFKKKDSDKDAVNKAIRKEFDEIIVAARTAPLSTQARVGKGVTNALSDFDKVYTKEIFQNLPFPERTGFIETLAKKQDSLRVQGGDVSVEHIGYSLVSKWVIAVAMGDNQLVKHFEDHMVYFKRAAGTL